MLRYDEDKRGLNCRTKGHIEIKMHLGRGGTFVVAPLIHVVNNC